jgi:hypothetical protein
MIEVLPSKLENELTRIMREGLKSESHLCYKHVV